MAATAAVMLLGSVGLWVGVPLLWLWVGSFIESKTDSLGTAYAVSLTGAVATILAMVVALTWLNRKQAELRGQPADSPLFEGVMAVSAGVATVLFAIWFLFFSGTNPLPIQAL